MASTRDTGRKFIAICVSCANANILARYSSSIAGVKTQTAQARL